MEAKVRIAAGIMVGFGVALAGVAGLSAAGLVPLSIDFFGLSLDGPAERIGWIGAWCLVAVLGLTFLVVTRPSPASSRREGDGHREAEARRGVRQPR